MPAIHAGHPLRNAAYTLYAVTCSHRGRTVQAFQKQLYNGIPNVTVSRALRRGLHLKAYRLYIVQGFHVLLLYPVSDLPDDGLIKRPKHVAVWK
jgi:hypothetical protein